jgi:hypothetical protein
MGDGIHINRLDECCSSHTQMRSGPRGRRTSGDAATLREKLIEATVEVLAEGGDPRLL